MNLLKICNRIIEYSFYALFLLVPLAFTSKTSELFEMNKMWLTWGITIIIIASWLIKMVLQKKILFQRTPLDIPIGLFLVSQIISTIFSLDPHVSLWGYYSRFNGGLLSIASYILLYYAFLSNFKINNSNNAHEKPESVREFRENFRDFSEIGATTMVKRLLVISLISGAVVGLWGLPSHFGYDPTCLLFRGTFDVSCWTADFLPKVRIFSTLGQPDWLAAYLAILIPISIAFAIKNHKSKITNPKQIQNHNNQNSKHLENFENWNLFGAWNLKFVIFTGLSALFYVDLLYTRARSGFLGIWISLIFFVALYWWFNGKPKISFSREKLKSPFVILAIGFLVVTFIIGTPINQLNKFTLEGIIEQIQKIQTSKNQTQSVASGIPAPRSSALQNEGGTESGDIRLLVWEGALNAWKANPIFGTGVETFAFAYYKYKPIGQNLTSEWNYLYNKAHNEYLNYLATTGIVGLGSYLLMIGSFMFIALKNIKSKITNLKQTQNHNNQNSKHFENLNIKNWNLFGTWNFEFGILSLALLASYISILITNFFGFSVVITNIYLFMIPAFIFVLTSQSPNHPIAQSPDKPTTSLYQWTGITFIILASCFMILGLFRFWQADIAFALGYNLDRASEYQQAYPNLHKAVMLRGDESVFKDELSLNDAVIAAGLVSQKSEDTNIQEKTISLASSLAQEAINTSNEVISKHSNNAVFWKTRVRVFYTLSQVDSRYLPRALDAIEKASALAPNDANISYNLGVLYGQNNNIKNAISAMEKTVQLKPDYKDAHYALGLFYHTDGQNEKAIAQMQYILNHFSANDSGALASLKDWGK